MMMKHQYRQKTYKTAYKVQNRQQLGLIVWKTLLCIIQQSDRNSDIHLIVGGDSWKLWVDVPHIDEIRSFIDDGVPLGSVALTANVQTTEHDYHL